MKLTQMMFKNDELILSGIDEIVNGADANLILGFGAKNLIADEKLYNKLIAKYPSSEIVLCSTAGEILGKGVFENTVSITAIQFEKTKIKSASVNLKSFKGSFDAGKALIEQFNPENLAYIFVLSDGLMANGSRLVKGMEAGNTGKVPITGGLAGDGTAFNFTLVGLNGHPEKGKVVAIGFYGKDLQINHSSNGGWDVFGPERTVTKSSGTKVFEIDNRSAIELYKIYLGPYTDDRTNSTLLFPFSVKLPGSSMPMARSILEINYKDDCMVFTGDVPIGSTVRFMKASFDKLIDAAADAAQQILAKSSGKPPKLAILISCVGRKVVLEKQIGDEVDAVSEVFGVDTALLGFYSYGEISPNIINNACEMFNQTMTVTTLNEL
jgi:hypothetical protein